LVVTHHVPARRPAARPSTRRRGSGLSRSGKTVSKAQQRMMFARYGDAARKFTTRGRYRRLPERKRAPSARSAR